MEVYLSSPFFKNKISIIKNQKERSEQILEPKIFIKIRGAKGTKTAL